MMPAETTILNRDSAGAVRRNGEDGEALRHEGTKARSSSAKAKSRRGNKAARQGGAEATGGDADAKLERYRARLKAVATILNGVLGKLKDEHPSLWEKRAYLMLVGVIYERLVLFGAELPTDEVVDLAKVLTTNRRPAIPKPQPNAPPAEPETPVATQVADAARALYGVDS